MLTHHFAPVQEFGIKVSVEGKSSSGTFEKRDVVPNPNNGSIGKLNSQDIIKITIDVEGKDHSCYILDPNSFEPIMRKEIGNLPEEVGISYYEKKMTVIFYNGKTCIAPWPNNMFCLDVEEKKFSIGIFVQDGEFYLANEQYEPDNQLFIPGEVKWFSLLRGFGAVATKCLDSRIHWSILPPRKNGLKYLNTGDMVYAKKVETFKYTNRTKFESEIKEMIFVE